jgi:hypothetical protein
MQFTKLFKKDKVTDEKTQENQPKKNRFSFFKHDKAVESDLPKGFANDATRTTSRPDTLFGFDDPTARKLGPVNSHDPTNTGA